MNEYVIIRQSTPGSNVICPEITRAKRRESERNILPFRQIFSIPFFGSGQKIPIQFHAGTKF